MCRGNRREPIFRDERDRVTFLETLGEVCERTGWIVHASVLMINHYHWLLETMEEFRPVYRPARAAPCLVGVQPSGCMLGPE